jgi:hypothetical protein
MAVLTLENEMSKNEILKKKWIGGVIFINLRFVEFSKRIAKDNYKLKGHIAKKRE